MTDLSPKNSKIEGYRQMLECIESLELEKAISLGRRYNLNPTPEDMATIINSSHWEDQQLKALEKLRNYGCDPEKIIPKIILPEGYDGKILIVTIMGGLFDRHICLRSGDLWHRALLIKAETELKNLGFYNSSAFEMGGAHIRFETNRNIVIFGTSNDFGSCDKDYASELVHGLFQNRTIEIRV